MNGRNFLDLALLIPGRLADEHRQHAAVRRNVGGARPRHLDRQPAQPVEQLHRRRALGQRRCRRAQRDSVRRGCGRAVSGGDVRRPGRAGPRARRLHQRRHEERHERRCTARSTTSSATTISTRRTRSPARRCRWTSSSTAAASAGRSRAIGRSYFSNFEQRLLDQTGLVTILAENRADHQRQAGGRRLPGFAGHHRHLSESCSQRQRARKGRSPGQRIGSAHACGTASITSTSDNSRGAGALNAPTASAGLDNIDHSLAIRQHLDDLVADRQRNAGAVRVRRLARRRRPTRSGPRSASPAWHRSARSPAARPGA